MSTPANSFRPKGFFARLGSLFGFKREGTIVIPVRGGASAWLPQSTTQAKDQSAVDHALLYVLIGILMFGVVMVYSASVALPDNPRFSHLPSWYFVLKHVISMGLGLLGMLFMLMIPVACWEKLSWWIFYGVSLVGLFAVLFLGSEINGAKRWLPFGVMNFQPTEFAKFAMVLYASSYMVRKMDVKEKFFKAVTPMVVAVGLLGVLIMAQPDMGAFLVIAMIAIGILFLGGVNARMFFLITCVLVLAFSLMVLTSPWRLERVLGYLDPWDPANVYGKSYQLTHALMALGRGMLYGVGLGNSMEKLNWLPEAHTDFITAVIGEELGFVGIVLLVIVFFWLIRRMIFIGRRAISLDRVFAGLAAQGVAIWLGFQAFIHIGVNLGVLPTKGLTLPFVSYGGSAILMNLIAMGLVLRIDIENRAMMRGESR